MDIRTPFVIWNAATDLGSSVIASRIGDATRNRPSAQHLLAITAPRNATAVATISLVVLGFFSSVIANFAGTISPPEGGSVKPEVFWLAVTYDSRMSRD